MEKRDSLAERNEERREQLRAVVYRMLGSPGPAEDAVREAWLRLERTGAAQADSLSAWLRNSVSRVLLVVLDTLEPAERIAFVLHDMFGLPFSEIAPVVGRTPAATGNLASRARRKVRGTPAVPAAELAQGREAVSAFLKAARNGDLAGLLDVLAPDVVRRADSAALPPGTAIVVRGARAVGRGTMRLAARAQLAEVALVNGEAGAVVVLGGEPWIILTFTIADGKIAEYDVIADPARLRSLTLAVLD